MVNQDGREAGTGRRLGLLYWLLLGASAIIIGLQVNITFGAHRTHDHFASSLGAVLLLLALAGLVVHRFRRESRAHIASLAHERHRTELEENRYRLLVDNIDLGVTLVDDHHRIQMVNAAQARLFGREAGDFVGKFCFQEFERREEVCPHCPGIRAMETGQMHTADASGTGADNGPLEVVLRAFPVPGDDGKAAGFIEVVEDVTEKRNQESELRMALFSVDQAAEAVYWIRNDGSISYANEQACRALGYTRTELLDCTIFEVAPETLAAGWSKRWLELQASESRTYETHHRRKNGDTFPVEVIASHLEAEGKDFICYFARDTTVRKEAEADRLLLERRVQQTQKLESLGVMAGGIAHDFNNILTGVLGNTELALLQLPPEDPTVEFLRDIQTASTRAADLSHQMLAFSGKAVVQMKPLSLNLAIESMTHLLESAISKKAMLALDLCHDLPLVEADLIQVHQVIMNLVTNASEAIADGVGVVRVRTGVVEADHDLLASTYLDDELAEGRYSFLEVTDTGSGMDEETQERVFDPFFTTKFTGRGLGLAAALGIIRAHRGAIEIDSTPGHGTTIRVLFPCIDMAREGQLSGKNLPELEECEGACTVLVVDDEPAVRSLARATLEMAGFEVLLARDGQEGLEQFELHRAEIRLVLLDLTMPKLDGLETFHRLRDQDPDLRVILTSGHSEQTATERFAGNGLAGFLQKPFTPTTLLTKMKVLMVGTKS